MREVCVQRRISTHDLTKRSTPPAIPLIKPLIFQLTTSRRGRLSSACFSGSMSLFQLTTSRRGRRKYRHYILCNPNFNSRPHEEVDSDWNANTDFPYYFNSRPHEEVDNYSLMIQPLGQYFNSRPHEEVDDSRKCSCAFCGIFQLTTSRRGRLIGAAVAVQLRISTHDLTKRSTKFYDM